jgi:hypothetical protein
MIANIEKAQQRVKDLEEKLKQAKALKQKVEARAKAAESKQKRAADTRRKILVGAAILAKVEHGEWPKEKMIEMMNQQLTRDDDRALFNLDLPKEKSTQEAKPNAKTEIEPVKIGTPKAEVAAIQTFLKATQS